MPKPYRTPGKRIIHRDGGGKFRKTTLTDFGISQTQLQDGRAVCANCDHGADDADPWYPLIKSGYCPKCHSQEKQDHGK